MRRRMGAAVVFAAILVGAVVVVETFPRDAAPEASGFRFDYQSSLERNLARYLDGRERLLERLGGISAVRCAELHTYGYGSAGCDIVFEKAGRQRWYLMYVGTDFTAKPCPARLQIAPEAGPAGPCNVNVESESTGM